MKICSVRGVSLHLVVHRNLSFCSQEETNIGIHVRKGYQSIRYTWYTTLLIANRFKQSEGIRYVVYLYNKVSNINKYILNVTFIYVLFKIEGSGLDAQFSTQALMRRTRWH